MIIDFRYHVASLVAIFIALGLGIFIGSTLVGENFMENLVNEQKNWIGKLESDYLTLKKETNNLNQELLNKQAELNNYKKFSAEIKPYIINRRLQDKKYAIIQFEENDYYDELLTTLKKADAQITSSLNFSLSSFTKVLENTMLAEEVNNFIVYGERGGFIETLEQKGIIKVEGFLGQELDGVIIINSSTLINQAVIDNFLLPIINYLQADFPIYLVETSTTPKSVINQIGKFSNVCSIDNLDTIPGQIALVLSMQGKKGHFGINTNAESVIPIMAPFDEEKRNE